MKSPAVYLTVVYFAVALLFLGIARADEVSEKARARLYDGGMDEQPLVVQQVLTEPRTDGSEYTIQKKSTQF